MWTLLKKFKKSTSCDTFCCNLS